ncbi:MAG: 3'-5' exonuclease [Bacteroidetes bacterium]|nr:3'-5' exonuclease [Bacteroidota bacterium]
MSATTQHDLKLTRPLAFFDLETTGINTQSDRIIEIAVVKYPPRGTIREFEHRINPEISIPAAATAIHGITDADVALAPTFAQIAQRLLDFLEDCDLSGFNIRRFDLPLLQQEFRRCGLEFDASTRKVIDVQTIYHMKEPRDLSAALRFYCQRDHIGAHGAMADVRATAEIFSAQLQRYNDLPREIDALETVVHPKDPSWVDDDGRLVWQGNNVILTFGKHRGTPLQNVIQRDRDYIQWILDGSFPEATKDVIRRMMDGVMPKPAST